MSNNFSDLTKYITNQLERLDNSELKGEALKEENERAKAIATMSSQMINLGRLSLDVERFKDDRMLDHELPKLLDDSVE